MAIHCSKCGFVSKAGGNYMFSTAAKRNMVCLEKAVQNKNKKIKWQSPMWGAERYFWSFLQAAEVVQDWVHGWKSFFPTDGACFHLPFWDCFSCLFLLLTSLFLFSVAAHPSMHWTFLILIFFSSYGQWQRCSCSMFGKLFFNILLFVFCFSMLLD